MAFIAIRQIYTADFGNLWVSKKAFTSAESFAIVMFVETDVSQGTAFEAHFQVVNPRVQAGNWFRPREIPHAVLGSSHSHFISGGGGGTGSDWHNHAGSVAVPVHGTTIDLVAGHPIPGPSFIVYWWANTYSALVASLQGSETQNGFFFVRGLLSVGSGDLFDNSDEAWYRVTP
jgi:hypothetical protein